MSDICEALDPTYQMIVARLGRESTLLKDGKYVKDLSYLNRDVKDIIYLDFEDDKAEFHKDNVIILPRWEGDSSDRELYDLMPFLDNIGQAHGSDVRNENKKYGREGTGKKYMDIQGARRDFILKQRVSWTTFLLTLFFYRAQAWAELWADSRPEPAAPQQEGARNSLNRTTSEESILMRCCCFS